jgi:hypothetical protein
VVETLKELKKHEYGKFFCLGNRLWGICDVPTEQDKEANFQAIKKSVMDKLI